MLGLPAIASVAAGLALAGGGAPPAPVIEPEGVIVFASDRDGDWEIYAVNADGTGLRRITDNDVEDTGPIGSPDGSRVAFMRGDDVLVGVLDAGEFSLGDRGESPTGGFAWSPDGTKLAVGYYDDYTFECSLRIFDASGRPMARFGCPGSGRIAWSPDGKLLTVGSSDPFDPEPVSYLIELDTGTTEELPVVPSGWAPDGKRVVAVENTDGDETAQIVVYDLESDDRRVLAERSHLADGLAWSPTGNLIAFTGDDPESGTIAGGYRRLDHRRKAAGEPVSGWRKRNPVGLVAGWNEHRPRTVAVRRRDSVRPLPGVGRR